MPTHAAINTTQIQFPASQSISCLLVRSSSADFALSVQHSMCTFPSWEGQAILCPACCLPEDPGDLCGRFVDAQRLVKSAHGNDAAVAQRDCVARQFGGARRDQHPAAELLVQGL